MNDEQHIADNKDWRSNLDNVLQHVKESDRSSRERSIAITKIQEAIMWLGMDLKAINGGQSCYKHGYDAENTTVEPTADGLKL